MCGWGRVCLYSQKENEEVKQVTRHTLERLKLVLLCFFFFFSQKSSRKKDKEKQTCKGCNESFNFTKRKHHCKSCGAVSTVGTRASLAMFDRVETQRDKETSPRNKWKISFGQLTVCNSVLLQAICAKCSKTLDNKTSRVCPECFEASLSLENLGVGEQKRKAAPEVTHTP